MRRALVVCVVLSVFAACGGASSGQRTVLVDYDGDEFSSSVFSNYPAKLEAKPGQTVVFKQAWTGEPHTVTGGAFVNDVLAKSKDWLAFFENFDKLLASGADIPDPENPGEATFAQFAAGLASAKNKKAAKLTGDAWRALRANGATLPDLDNPGEVSWADAVTAIDEESDKAFSGVPFAFEDEGSIAQNVGQPCFKRKGALPLEAATPCAKAQQVQPAFDGKQSVYNSGLIRYEGVRGNSFKVKLADEIDPGTYYFYCAVHGFGQLTELKVKPKDAKVESAAEVARRARAQAEDTLRPLAKVYRQTVRSGRLTLHGEKLKGPFAGLYAEGADHALINEFLPHRITAKVNEPITWTALGSDHTISFDVPKYFPIIEFDTPKGIRLNPRLSRPAGGAPEIPKPDETDEESHEDHGGPLTIDGGTYDGSGFWSSGLFGSEPYAKYTLRISKPGTYPYACLIHPPMIGQIVVT
ncbi:MAG TPA: hypothetical protein VMZ22_01490 [Acidimicrobiales bacterium]|nr:hypothetical protein [Acidimicrobiales bacterium]